MSPEVEPPPFVHHCVPNRSLGARGRRWFLAASIAGEVRGRFAVTAN